MRMMMRVRIPVAAGNAGFQNGDLAKVIQNFISAHKPEAAYFAADGGDRTAYFVLDMTDVSMMPAMAEPFFQRLNARVDLKPVMSAADLEKGLAAAAG